MILTLTVEVYNSLSIVCMFVTPIYRVIRKVRKTVRKTARWVDSMRCALQSYQLKKKLG